MIFCQKKPDLHIFSCVLCKLYLIFKNGKAFEHLESLVSGVGTSIFLHILSLRHDRGCPATFTWWSSSLSSVLSLSIWLCFIRVGYDMLIKYKQSSTWSLIKNVMWAYSLWALYTLRLCAQTVFTPNRHVVYICQPSRRSEPFLALSIMFNPPTPSGHKTVSESIFSAKYVFYTDKVEVLGENC